MRSNGVSDPSWKSGPTYDKPTSDEHAIHSDDFVDFDFDGFGVDEAMLVDGDPLVVIQESAQCSREGCDAVHTRRLLFTTQPLDLFEKYILAALSGAEYGPYVLDNAERVGPETIIVGDIEVRAETAVENEAVGSCHGCVEPDPEPQWRDI